MTSKPVVLASYPGSPRGVYEGHVAMIEKHFNIVWWKDFEADRSQFAHSIKGIVCVAGKPSISEELIRSLPNLKVVSNFGVGVDHIDVPMVNRCSVKVGNTPDVLADSVADMAMLLMLAAARKIVQGVEVARSPDSANGFDLHWMGTDVHDATLGIVGMGDIGHKVAKRAKGFNMKILYHNRKQRAAEKEQEVGAVYCGKLSELLKQADYVLIACPLTAETKALISRKEFSLMKSNATILNVARGPIIDQDALVEALQSKTIAGAALDVTYPEPLPLDHPLLKLPNVIITPHHGSQTVKTRQQMMQLVIDNLLAGIHGNPLPAEVKQ
ncbi:glyoxylate/hydroxypyruvate reductase B-like [Ptychodera flava]|uniref:glyoxylate/hydroxypyruvate reductase B-like n=1 Tax=Ptychodera flava TaxID=63121 RepID=UPI00396A6F6A